MSDTDKYPVYLGVWTNWSRGQVFGLTLTLKRQEANLLIAFTAFFIALVSTRFWRIVCFAFHRHYATPSPQNTVYHQRQAILRNSSAAESGMLLLLQLIWANGRNGLGVLLSVVVAAFCVAAFAVAGGLSSQISTAVGTEVLIHSANCGYLDFNKVTAAGSDGDLEGYFALAPVEAEAINNAANYAQQCYSNATAKILDCGRFTKMALPIIVNNKAACPFQEAMCRSNSTNIQIDSGYIDSHEDLGLNSRADHRILARNVLHCAPIRTEGFTSQNNTSLGNLTLYHYGNITVPTGLTDYSFAVESIESQYAIARSPDFPVSGGNYGLA
jgi:hypothetical protein